MSQIPTEPSPSSSEAPSGPPPRRTPPWLPLVAKWTIVCALFGFVMGVALGAFTGTIMPEGSMTTLLALDRGILLALVGALLGAVAGALEWQKQERKRVMAELKNKKTDDHETQKPDA